MDDQDIGSYKVYIIVADDKGAETEYDILIQVDRPYVFQGVVVNDTD
jgi:uncharacterized protein YrzB (UPF0473 family)